LSGKNCYEKEKVVISCANNVANIHTLFNIPKKSHKKFICKRKKVAEIKNPLNCLSGKNCYEKEKVVIS
jgi:hypothetical protein